MLACRLYTVEDMAQKLAKFPKLKVPALRFLAEGVEKLPKVGNFETMI